MRLPALAIPFAALALLSFAYTAQAADPVYPPGARIGVTPPPGLEISREFLGFQDANKNAAILIVELPAPAYAEIDKAMSGEAAKQQNIQIEKRETIQTGAKEAVLFTGKQDVNGKTYRKWLMIASFPDITALVTAQVTEDSLATYSDAAIRASFASVAARVEPVEERLGMLPFKLAEMSGFRIVQIAPDAVLLADGGNEDAKERSLMIVSLGNGAPAKADERGNFARNAMSSIPGLRNVRVTSGEAMRVAGMQGFETRADALHGRDGEPVSVVQWLRFGSSTGFMRIVGVAPKEKWPDAFPRFRAVRDGVGSK